MGFRGFPGDVHRLGKGPLHSVSQFVCLDSGGEGQVAGIPGKREFVQFAGEGELGALFLGADSRGRLGKGKGRRLPCDRGRDSRGRSSA
jgi:hypothetical protein